MYYLGEHEMDTHTRQGGNVRLVPCSENKGGDGNKKV